MSQPYDRPRVPKADVLAKANSPLADIWRRWLKNLVDIVETKVGLPWKVDNTTGDLYPEGTGGQSDAGIGTLDNPVAHVAVGTQELAGVEGFVADRSDPLGGGISVVGYRALDPTEDPTPNAPVELAGSGILMTGPIYLAASAPILEDHYLIVGPSLVYNGKDYAPLLRGPEVVYSQTDLAIDANDYDVGDTTVQVVSLTLANDYNTPARTTFSYGVYLHERSAQNRQTNFVIEIYVDGGLALTNSVSLSGGEQWVTESISVGNPQASGVVVRMDVTGNTTHAQCDPWVEGTTRESFLEVKQN